MATIIRHPERITFIHIPKTGGNSITTWMKKNFKAEVSKRKQHANVGEAIKRFGDLGTTFCVVRNPWDYAVSWYTFNLYLARTYIKNINENPHMANNRKEKWNMKTQQAHLKRLEEGFGPWLKRTERPQQIKWAKKCDIVLKLETIDTDFKVIQEKLNCYNPLDIINKTPNRKDYKDYYDDELVNIVENKFIDDIKTFGYTFD